MLSPVLITRSGSSAASEWIQSRFQVCPGVRCASEKCSTRSGDEPAGSTGTSKRRNRGERRSMPDAVSDGGTAKGKSTERDGGESAHTLEFRRLGGERLPPCPLTDAEDPPARRPDNRDQGS